VTPGGFFYELKRRRVWRVAGAYVLVVWMGLEILLETAPVLGLPEWVPRAAVILSFLGFPVTLVLSWVYDLTAHGVVRTPSLPPDGATPSRSTPRPSAQLAGVFGAGIIVALVGFGAYSVIEPTRAPRPESIEAVAVLPFADLSADADQSYFADGVTEELINRLARVGDLQVAGRASSFAFRGGRTHLREISRELGVDAVVEGSVRRAGDRLRVNVELVDAATGYQIWSESYDRTVDDIFAIQDDIATAVVDALRLQLVPGTSRRRAGTESLRAHDAYLLGLARWNARTEEDLLRALDYFESAVEEDPGYASAHAGMALTYALLPAYTEIPPDLAAERGVEAAARALALDAQNAEAHAAIGQIAAGLEWNLDAAEMAYQRAIDFQPSYATAHQWYAEALVAMGRLAEAQAEIDQALDLDPLSVAAAATHAYLLSVRGETEGAVERYARLLEGNPGYHLGHAGLVFLCLDADCHDRADAAARAAWDPAVAAGVRAVIEADREATPVARATAASALDAATGLTTMERALLHAALGQRARAVTLVEEAYEEGEDPRLLLHLVHPLFDSVRRDPRFSAVTGALGVEAPMAALRR
jgi:TolB-like protein/Tfp pilus assembly protein PilF